jgi:hypothetical protein
VQAETLFSRRVICSIIILTLCFALPIAFFFVPASENATGPLMVSASVDKPSYYLRETVNITGDLLEFGSPAAWGLVSLEIRRPLPAVPVGEPVLFRTVTVGTPTETWRASITGAQLRDGNGNPINGAVVNSMVQIAANINNFITDSISGYIAVSLCDGNLIPIYATYSSLLLPGSSQTTVIFGPIPIPAWAYCGRGLIFVDFLDDLPMNGGTAYTPELATEFYITRNSEVQPVNRPPANSYGSSTGKYSIAFQVSPSRDEIPEAYPVYVTARVGYNIKASSYTQFSVQDEPCPPQAAFTYSPLRIYQNMSAKFDASSSSAEGYNDNITDYKWTFNDPYNPQQTESTSPVTYHAFPQVGTYVVDLNVTDSEGLWSTTSKPVRIVPEIGPVANFTWTPQQIFNNTLVTFDASGSQTGWSASEGQFSTIVSYTWNFADGTPNIIVATAVTTHNFAQGGNYMVTLTITDDAGRTATVSSLLQVQNVAYPRWDVNQDSKIRVDDILIVAQHYGLNGPPYKNPADPGWDPRADVTGDGKVRVDDILLVARHFGQDTTKPCYWAP